MDLFELIGDAERFAPYLEQLAPYESRILAAVATVERIAADPGVKDIIALGKELWPIVQKMIAEAQGKTPTK